MGYCTVATAQSALSSFIAVDSIKVGEHSLVSRSMTGLTMPEWNPQIVLKTFPAIDSMSLKQLTLKLLMLTTLLSAERPKPLQKLTLEKMCTVTRKNTHYTYHLC